MTGGRLPVPTLRERLARAWARDRLVWAMLAPVLAYFAVFQYVPMAGNVIAFFDYNPGRGIAGSDWVGLEWFRQFFHSLFVHRLIVNTLLMNVYDLLVGFPAPLVLALLMNELTSLRLRRFVQTVSYVPHFISVVVVAGLMIDFLARDGLVGQVVESLGGTPGSYLTDPGLFRALYVGSEVWQNVGWGSIIYLAALAGINPSLYEAARVDGANRWQRLLHITLPGLLPVTTTLLILRLGQMMTVGFEKLILLYNPSTYETGDVIATYVFRRGLLESNYSYAAAVGLLNAAVALALLWGANRLSRRLTGNSIW